MGSHETPPTWIDACQAYAAAEGVAEWVVDDLSAFSTAFPRGGPPVLSEGAWADGFEALDDSLSFPLDTAALAAVMAQETGGRQPAIFARRTAAVETLLHDMATPAARILRVGLRMRLEGMCSTPSPRLRRVRALADFYYSLAVRLRHPEWSEDLHRLEELAARVCWREVAPGLEHALIDGLADGMPVHANLLRADLRRVRVDVADLHVATHKGATLAEAAGSEALAALSGGYFLYSEDDITLPSRRHDPVGLLLIDGTVISPPVFRRATLLVGEDGVELRPLGMDAVGLHVEGRPVQVASFHNRAQARVGPDEPSIAVAGLRVVAVGARLPVPLNGFVACVDADALGGARVGMAVSYDPPLAGGRPARAGIAGGPMLVEGGEAVLDMRAEDFWGTAPPITFSQDETGDRNMLARMAIGVDAEGRLLAAAIDGRNMQRALGMTLGHVSRLMMRLGCVTAANFDGGSSKRMLVGGRIVDLPSTEIVAGESEVVQVRPVHSAILFRPA